jgi:hypothetical protein
MKRPRRNYSPAFTARTGRFPAQAVALIRHRIGAGYEDRRLGGMLEER